MSQRTSAVAALAALITLAATLPGLASPAAASSCSGWTSSTTPPPTIRVLRHASGLVDTVGFKRYTKNVLSREWIPSWTTASLRAGALTTKHYAWYQVLHWRGGTNADGACFDIRDDVVDQVYDPSKPIYATARAAVNATWATRVLKYGDIFPTYYNGGKSGETCGANANGLKLYQWGTQACGLAGKGARRIIRTYYYPGVTITDAPPPSPTPTTPSPTPDA
jgi:peptidoglycan hydrolase-like amidase